MKVKIENESRYESTFEKTNPKLFVWSMTEKKKYKCKYPTVIEQIIIKKRRLIKNKGAKERM